MMAGFFLILIPVSTEELKFKKQEPRHFPLSMSLIWVLSPEFHPRFRRICHLESAGKANWPDSVSCNRKTGKASSVVPAGIHPQSKARKP